MGWVIPFASLVTAAIVPLAAGLYLLTTTAWTLGERTVLRRRFISLTESASPRPVTRVWRHPGRQRRRPAAGAANAFAAPLTRSRPRPLVRAGPGGTGRGGQGPGRGRQRAGRTGAEWTIDVVVRP